MENERSAYGRKRSHWPRSTRAAIRWRIAPGRRIYGRNRDIDAMRIESRFTGKSSR